MTQRLDRLDLLVPWLREPALAFVQTAEQKLRVKLFIVFTWRSAQEQDRLYQQGREFQRADGIWVVSDEAKVVTNAKAGTSAHNVITKDGKPASMALDVVPMGPDGTLRWEMPEAEWQPIWALAWKFGFDPLGDAVGAYLKWDQGHLEEPAWKWKLAGLGLVQTVSEGIRTTV